MSSLPPVAPAGEELGLRERKKLRTRAAIAKAATDLFREHGFEAVTVEQIARAAEVSRPTIFNYFSSKEEMLFDRDQAIEDALLEALRKRREGDTPIHVFRSHTRVFWERVKASAASSQPTPEEFWRIVEPSTTLRNRIEITFVRHAQAVAVALAEERGAADDDPSCHALARSLCGINAAILTCGLHRLTRGDDAATVANEMLLEAQHAYDVLEHGLTGR